MPSLVPRKRSVLCFVLLVVTASVLPGIVAPAVPAVGGAAADDAGAVDASASGSRSAATDVTIHRNVHPVGHTSLAAGHEVEDGNGNESLMSLEYPRPRTETDVGNPARKSHSQVIPFRSGRVVLKEGLDPAVLEADRTRLYVLVQFETQPEPELLDRYGYRSLDVLAYNTHFAAIPRERVEAFAAREEVRAVASVRSEWKLEPALAEALERGGETERVPVTVGTFEPVERLPGGIELGRVRGDTFRGTLTPEQVRQLQQEYAVRWVELDTPTRLGLAQGGDLLNSRRVNVRGYTGDGVRVGVIDTGIQHDHAHFDGVQIVDSYDERDGDYYPEADNWNWSGNAHGTHVAGTVAGRSTSNGVELVGIAPDATLVVARGLGTDQFDRIAENDTDLITNSWGGGSNGGQYRTSSRYTDGWARDHEDTLLLFCYGNWNGNRSIESFVWEPGLAKNVLTVGAIHDGSDGVGVDGSSVASLNEVASLNNRTIPADGRVKPEVNAPGKWITAPVVNDSYADYQGCSMATPHVAGVVALVEEAYGGGGSGGLTANQHKALLVATTGPVENPNGYAAGYGGVDALNAVYENDYESLQRFYGGSIGEREAQTHAFSVPSGAEEVVVSLSWFDPKASANSQDTLVNDLDLYLGPESDPRRYELIDTNQNVLKQVVDDPQAGDWVLTVYGWEVDGADQRYDGVVRVVTDEPTLSLDTFDRVTYASDRPNVTFPVALQGSGAPVTGASVRVTSAGGMGNCGPEFGVAGTLSARGASVVDLCFEPNARAAGDTFTVELEATSTNGQPRTLTETVTVVAAETTPPEPFDVTLVGHSRTGGGVDYYTDQTELTFEWERPDDLGLEPRGIAQYAYHLGRVPSSPPESAYTQVAESDPSIDRGGTTRGVTVSGLSDGLYLFRVVAGDLYGNERTSTATVCVQTSESSPACRPPPTEEERRQIDIIASSRFDFAWHELPERLPVERLRCRGYRLCDNPGYRWITGDERLAIYVDAADGGRYTYFAEIDGGSVTRFEAVDGAEAMRATKPTMNVYTDEATMMRIASDDDPLTEFAAARDAGDVRIEGVSLGARLKLGLAGLAEGVLDFLVNGGLDRSGLFD